MNIVITGATGFVGQALCQYWHEKGHTLMVVSRQPEKAHATIGVPVMARAAAVDFADQQVDAVINLAGEPIFNRRWSESQKKKLIASRLKATQDVGELCQRLESSPRQLISGSAMGYYGDQGRREVTEQTSPHDEFAHRLCREWEEAAQQLATDRMKVACIRIGLVLDRDGGMLKPMRPMFRLGVGGRLGKGEQYMPWIHRHDLVRIIDFLLHHDDAQGAWNAGAPQPVTNAEFTRTLAASLHRPAPFVVPAGIISLALGEMSQLLLTGARMMPARLEAAGFRFEYPTLEKALTAIEHRAA
ncbi:epimerase [Kushneria pakistanensis]|uniref:Epimerase n=1 Tax=Kushneria pakistanensis TaxID=1508770 RepID=A0ABQ3FK67_9GAMM|nr:TIGR01777 family oxidoreductase [Kushneria pakistanensis]GHC27894.1 epimerase [Kushneria pakistanensis]